MVDHEAAVATNTHTKEVTIDDKTHIFRKNERTDLTRVSINNLPIELLNRIKHFVIDNYGPNIWNK